MTRKELEVEYWTKVVAIRRGQWERAHALQVHHQATSVEDVEEDLLELLAAEHSLAVAELGEIPPPWVPIFRR